MTWGQHETSTPTTQSSRARGQDAGVPLITWIIGAVTVVVVILAGALFLDPSPQKLGDRGASSDAAPEPAAPMAGPSEAPVEMAAVRHPLDLTDSYIDAQERAKLWNSSAILSGIDVVIEDGRPQGAIVFEFGQALGQPVPGTPLSARRHSLSYEGKSVSERSSESTDQRLGLPEPNCPLEVAFRKLTEAGVKTSGRVAILYTHSQKHGKPVWLVTDESSQATSLNADNCALLRR